MRICPGCLNTTSARDVERCADDGRYFVEAADYKSSDSDPRLGTVVAGRFVVLARIGSGGMGAVYRARQISVRREVALKILKREYARDAETVARFHREAQATSSLSHPNTVTVFDFGQTEDGLLFIAMELLRGELLSARTRQGPLDVREAIRIGVQVLRSLAEAHEKGIVHRDLKPDNIFLSRVTEKGGQQIVKVLDFGIAKILAPDPAVDVLTTQAGTVFGTPRYMSPEQAQGKTLDPRSDLYALGVILFHCLTGRPPFPDDDAVVVMAKHIRQRPPELHAMAPDRPIPASLGRLVHRALAKLRERRPQSATAFADALEACLADVDEAEARLAAGLSAAPRRPWGRISLTVGGSTAAAGLAMLLLLGPAPAVSSPPVQEAMTSVSAAASPSATVRVTVQSSPPGARVRAGGRNAGTTPAAFDLARSAKAVAVHVALPGYVEMEQRVVPQQDQVVSFTLARVAAPANSTVARGAAPAVRRVPGRPVERPTKVKAGARRKAPPREIGGYEPLE